MRLRALAAGLVGSSMLFAAPASAAVTTLGSPLTADATITEAHQQDSVFWADMIGGATFAVPADGQIKVVRLKGSVLREEGAADPLNEVHFQTLRPRGDGSMDVILSSQPFYVPIDGPPNQISTYAPENLCVKAGDSVGFNDEGGWQYGGPGKLDPNHYQSGAPFRVFGEVSGSSTFRFTKHDGTGNGSVLSSPVLRGGVELLMQFDLATGVDASEPCGGPRRHADGSLVFPEGGDPGPKPAAPDPRVQMGDDGDSLQAGTAAANFQVGGGGRDRQSGKGGNDVQAPDATTATVCALRSVLFAALDQLIATYGHMAALVSVIESMKRSLGSLFGGFGCASSARWVAPGPLAVAAAAKIDDRLFGGKGSDVQDAGPGNDRLNGGPGTDVLLGGPGRDVINARDFSADLVRCGTGRDVVLADKRDLISPDCERVRRR